MSGWICTAANHPGDRVIKIRLDRYQRRSEYVRDDGQHLMKTIIEKKMCADCARKEIAARIQRNEEQTEAMF